MATGEVGPQVAVDQLQFALRILECERRGGEADVFDHGGEGVSLAVVVDSPVFGVAAELACLYSAEFFDAIAEWWGLLAGRPPSDIGGEANKLTAVQKACGMFYFSGDNYLHCRKLFGYGYCASTVEICLSEILAKWANVS